MGQGRGAKVKSKVKSDNGERSSFWPPLSHGCNKMAAGSWLGKRLCERQAVKGSGVPKSKVRVNNLGRVCKD